MAMAITFKKLAIPTEFVTNVGTPTSTATSSGAQSHWELPDQTTTGPTPVEAGGRGDMGVPRNVFRALVWFKSLTAGGTSTGSIQGPAVRLEVATSTGFNPYFVVDEKLMGAGSDTTTSTGAQQFSHAMFLFGAYPLAAGAQFARVNFASSNVQANASSTALDVILEGG